MKSFRLYHANDLRLEEKPIPSPAEGEALVRITAVSICGSDLHWYSEGGILPAKIGARGVILGHELAGVVVGGELDGTRVAIDPAISCGRCEYCREGNPNFCASQRFAGDGSTDGGLQEYLAWPKSCLVPLPDSISNEEGAMLEAMGVSLHAINLAHLKPGMTVGVFGCGPIGLLAVQLARVSGAAAIYATDCMPNRLDAAQAYGASNTFLADGSEDEAILSATNGRGLDVVIEAAGENRAVEAAVNCAKRGARAVLAGIPADDRISFQASTARHKGLSILLCRRMKHTYPRAIALVERGMVDLKSLMTSRYPFQNTNEAFQTAVKREGLKVLIAAE